MTTPEPESDAAATPGPDWLRAAPWMLTAAVLLVFGWTCSLGVLNYDSDTYIAGNPLLSPPTPASLVQLWRPGSVAAESLYIPVTYTSWWLESLAGGSAALRHGVNVLLHLLSVLLLWRLALALLRRPGAALLAGLLYALHPLQVESVAWLMGRKDLLSSVGALAAMLLWLRWLRAGRARGSGFGLLLLILVCCLFSWLAKPGTLVLPALLLGLGWAAGCGAPRRREYLAAFTLLGAAVAIYVVNSQIHVDAPAPPLGLAERVGAVPELLLGWILRLALLAPPQVYYDWPSGPTHFYLHAAFGLLALGLIAGFVAAWRLRQRVLAWSLLSVAAALLPVVSVTLAYRAFLTADHYAHFLLAPACIGLLALGGLPALQPIFAARPRLAGLAGGALLLLALARTLVALPAWRSDTSFWQTAVRQAPAAPEARYNLGATYEAAGRELEAIAAYEAALALAPGHRDSNYNLANLLAQGPYPQRALPCYEAALATDPHYLPARMNLGNLYLHLGRPADAAAAYQRVSEYDSPYRAMAQANLALAQSRLGDPAPAPSAADSRPPAPVPPASP